MQCKILGTFMCNLKSKCGNSENIESFRQMNNVISLVVKLTLIYQSGQRLQISGRACNIKIMHFSRTLYIYTPCHHLYMVETAELPPNNFHNYPKYNSSQLSCTVSSSILFYRN